MVDLGDGAWGSAASAALVGNNLDRIEPEDPTRTRFRFDPSAQGIEIRLVLEVH